MWYQFNGYDNRLLALNPDYVKNIPAILSKDEMTLAATVWSGLPLEAEAIEDEGLLAALMDDEYALDDILLDIERKILERGCVQYEGEEPQYFWEDIEDYDGSVYLGTWEELAEADRRRDEGEEIWDMVEDCGGCFV
ncbi:MAG: hypothetical protein LBR80_01720 [Deltaproteobacteria bacterium]|nr:hypothetical protein [Deltaproteobacteria bacterium]